MTGSECSQSRVLIRVDVQQYVCECVCACVHMCAHLFYCLISLCLLFTLPALHSHLNVSNSHVFAGGHTCSCTTSVLQYTDLLTPLILYGGNYIQVLSLHFFFYQFLSKNFFDYLKGDPFKLDLLPPHAFKAHFAFHQKSEQNMLTESEEIAR